MIFEVTVIIWSWRNITIAIRVKFYFVWKAKIQLSILNSEIIFISVTLIVISWPYQLYSIFVVTTDNWRAFLMFYVNLYNNFSIISREFQFIGLCWIIQARIDDVEVGLKNVFVEIDLVNGKWINIINYFYKTLINFFISGLTNSAKIKRLKTATTHLVKAFRKMNSLYSFPLLIALTSLSLNTMFEMYFTIFGGFTKNSNKTSLNFQRTSNIANNAISSLYYFARFFLICFVANKVTDKVT